MGMRLRKSIKVGKHARINISKSGIGGSVGVKGARITKTTNGRTRKTVSIPGTGVSYVSESGSRKHSSSRSTKTYNGNPNPPIVYGVAGTIGYIASIVCLLAGLLFVIASLSFGWVFVALGVIFFFVGKSNRKKYRGMKNEVLQD